MFSFQGWVQRWTQAGDIPQKIIWYNLHILVYLWNFGYGYPYYIWCTLCCFRAPNFTSPGLSSPSPIMMYIIHNLVRMSSLPISICKNHLICFDAPNFLSLMLISPLPTYFYLQLGKMFSLPSCASFFLIIEMQRLANRQILKWDVIIIRGCTKFLVCDNLVHMWGGFESIYL